VRTIGGGIVRYVDVRLLPCPEDPSRIGECEGPGRIDIIWQERVVESFEVGAGDAILVADDAEVAPDQELAVADPWARSLRAAIPLGVEAVVRWSEPVEILIDEGTGLTRRRFTRGPVTLTLAAREQALMTRTVERDVTPLVETGAIVRRGDLLASLPRYRALRELVVGIDTLRAWLDVRPLDHEPRALVAPCDATVVELDETSIVLRAPSERVLTLPRPPRAVMLVVVGDNVRAGDPLSDGERDHRELFDVWGAARFSGHLLEELELICGRRVPRVYWALVLRAMLAGGELRGVAARARRARAT